VIGAYLYKEYAKNSGAAALSFADLVALTTDRNVTDETFITTDLQRVLMQIQGEDGRWCGAYVADIAKKAVGDFSGIRKSGQAYAG
jgi:hypothetical protein